MHNYEITLNRDYYHKQREIVNWCLIHFGYDDQRWSWSSIFGSTFFYFTEEKDYSWFILKWTL